jgi:hypothetical protein
VTASWPETPEPPTPFEPRTGVIDAGAVLYRVHSNAYRPTQFNPGPNGAGRFHFFGDPMVPVLYLAETREAALAETLLRNIPVDRPYPLRRRTYEGSVLAGLETRRPLRIAELFGLGLRTLGIEATQLTDTPGENYPQTRKWAEAAYDAGLDGIGWMSKRDNSARAYMLFEGRADEDDLEIIPGSGLVFAGGAGFDWLAATCAPLKIDVMPA